jgi:hypothetical protein
MKKNIGCGNVAEVITGVPGNFMNYARNINPVQN